MQALERREKIKAHLEAANAPVSATTLSELCGVSRQVIVGDVALLRAGGADVSATPRGYIMGNMGKQTAGIRRTVACIHTPENMRQELYAIVDNGGEAVDVIVEHPIYGQITAVLQIRSRYEVEQFMKKTETQGARPLSTLTGGVHLHTIACPTEQDMSRIIDALQIGGFLFQNG